MQTVSRLINQFKPDEYDLSLTMNRQERTFHGVATIKGIAQQNESIALHAKELTIRSVTIDGKAAEFSAGHHDELQISHPDINPGRHIVVVDFSGSITDAMHGLYPCYYTHEGKKKELLATQFESHHAREAFPCVDEPEAKAVFNLTLTTETDVTVLGNTPIQEQTIEDGMLVTRFEPTPRMSTYLLAWVVGELQRKTATTKNGVEVNIWATHAHKHESLDFALDIATRSIDFFNDYFGVDYPLTKCDHVALPDFSSGAMENWGLITYREMALLAPPKSTSVSSKHYIATVIAHELSHQWFGNLVTMKWWNNLWLNESFATLMEYIAIDALEPEWNVWLDFATSETIMALRRDSLDGIQAVQVDVRHPDEISTLFDGAIVYAKGARLMRMLEQYVGSEAFRAGLNEYFTTFAYGNTEGEDLWRMLGKASGKNVASFMNVWISQPGYPVVSVQSDDTSIHLQQKRFFTAPHEPSDTIWPIPLSSSSESLPDILESGDVTISSPAMEPLRLNVGNAAHFITQYDERLLDILIEQVRVGKLGPLDRLQLLNEQTLLARGGEMSSARLLPMLAAFKNEDSEPVWDVISMGIRELRKFVESDEAAEKRLRRFAADMAREQYRRLGWESAPEENEADTKLRATAVSLMLYGEDEEAIQTAIQLFERHGVEQPNAELRSLIIGAAVRHGKDDTLIETLVSTYRSTTSPELQSDIAAAVSSTKVSDNLQRLLELIRNSDTVRTQDAARWFAHILYNRDGRKVAWQWLKDNWEWIRLTFQGDKSYDDFPRIAANALSTHELLIEFRDFFSPMKEEPALNRVIDIGITEIEGRVNAIERDGGAVIRALREL